MKQLSSKKTRRISPPRLLTDLANMREDRIAKFRRRWKLYAECSDSKLRDIRDELRLLWAGDIPVDLKEDDTLKHPVPEPSAHARELEEHWQWHQTGSHPTGEPLQQFICAVWLKQAGTAALLVDWENRRLKPDAKNLRIVLLWGCLQNADRLAYCHNPDCNAPFFIAKRKDQQFCSDKCAAPAKRAAKLRWWNANRAGIERDKDPGQM